MYALLPPLNGRRVLCVGCGTAEECVALRQRGADVHDCDLTATLVAYARRADPTLLLTCMDMHALAYRDASFDVVYASLVLHYAADWRPILREFHRVTLPGAEVLLSTHHPLTWGAERSESADGRLTKLFGFEQAPGAQRVFGDYFRTCAIDDIWFDELAVRYYHRPLASIMQDILESGWQLEHLGEPQPLPELASYDPQRAERYNKLPLFLILKLRRKP